MKHRLESRKELILFSRPRDNAIIPQRVEKAEKTLRTSGGGGFHHFVYSVREWSELQKPREKERLHSYLTRLILKIEVQVHLRGDSQ